MSLEFFTYPQMHYFFGEDTNRFILSLGGGAAFIPYDVQWMTPTLGL